MGKQRTPQGRQPGRTGGTPRKPGAAPTAPAQSTIPAELPAEVQAEPSLPEAAFRTEAAEPLQAHLLDTVSPETLAAAAPEPEGEAPEPAPVPADANFAEAPPQPEPDDAEAITEDVAEAIAAPADEAADEPATKPVSESAGEPEQAREEPAPAAEAAKQLEPEAASAPREAAGDPYANVVPLKSPVPVPAPVAAFVPALVEAEAPPSDGSLPSPASWRAGHRPIPALRQDLEGMGETLFAFMRNESTAIIAHLNALKDARSPADAIRLQVTEIQRAADASLTCWSEIARRATRMVVHR